MPLNPRPAPQKCIFHHGERPSNTSVPADLWNISSGETCCNQLVNANMLHPPIVAGISNSPISHGPGPFLGNHVLQWHLCSVVPGCESYHDPQTAIHLNSCCPGRSRGWGVWFLHTPGQAEHELQICAGRIRGRTGHASTAPLARRGMLVARSLVLLPLLDPRSHRLWLWFGAVAVVAHSSTMTSMGRLDWRCAPQCTAPSGGTIGR
ncbi:hypothetical protein B0T18DRAFT_155166 [Schizothecium vesticola]|uniref:Uncharacterized protein n=1 Tax=Schizothecium vesticola TaxID=314040 RepID=A0AA40K5D7_9PEZI|nr:hypothetical protein B0T18DRAFT_155166 [Schizothecium vesticola]